MKKVKYGAALAIIWLVRILIAIIIVTSITRAGYAFIEAPFKENFKSFVLMCAALLIYFLYMHTSNYVRKQKR